MEFPLITSVFLHVTNACNSRCVMCFEAHRPEYMTYQTAKDTADFLIRNAEITGAVPAITFFGGEPLLCWDSIIVPLTEYIRNEYHKPFRLSMTSNCTLLTEERLKFMNQHNISLLFSIDGDRETQEYNRPLASGESSFDAVLPVLDLIPVYRLGTMFRSTIIPETCHNVFHNMMFAKEHGYDACYVVPNTLQEWDERSLRTLAGEMRKYSDYMINAFRTDDNTYLRFPEFERTFSKIQQINTAIANDTCRPEKTCGACAKCGLGTQRFAAVGFDGKLYGCQELACNEMDNDIFLIGDIYNGVDQERRERLATSYDRTVEHGEDCKNCRLARICHGGCVAHNYQYTGNINKMPPMACWWYQCLLEEAIYICGQMGEDPPEAFLQFWRRVNDGGRY